MIGVASVRPGSICPFQRKMYGTRTPPSYSMPLPPLSGALSVMPSFSESRPLIAAHAAVVAGENHQRVLGQPKLIELRQDAANAFVDARDHRRVRRIVMPARRRLVLEPLDQLLLRLVRRVHAEVRQVQEERLVLVPLDEIDRAVRQKIGQVLTLRILGLRVGLEIEMPARRLNRLVEAALARMMLRTFAQVPLAEHAGRVAGLLQRVGDRDLVQRQPRDVIDRPQRPALPVEAIDVADGVDARPRPVLAA